MYIIGDVHGNYETLKVLIAKLPTKEDICFVGDLIDRGPKSKGVVALVKDNNYPCVMANHEAMMLDFFKDRDVYNNWLNYNGGAQTVASYGKISDIVNNEILPKVLEEHLDWMSNLPKYLEFKDIKSEDGRHLFVSHAGLYSPVDNTTSYLEMADRLSERYNDIFWHRDKIHDYPEIYQVIGHTPQKNGPRIEKHFANVDTGCFIKQKGHKTLTALRFPQMEIYQQENID